MLLSIISSRHRTQVETAFVATYNIASNGETLTLPVLKDYQIDWGDGVETTTGNSHTYTSAGVKTVKMYGVVDDFAFGTRGDKLKIITIENGGGIILNSVNFSGCSNLSTVLFSSNTICQNPFNSIFGNCEKLNSDLSYLDVSNVTSTSSFLTRARLFDSLLPLNTDNCTNFSFMLDDANVFNQPLNGLNVSKATDLTLMFRRCRRFDQQLNNWDTSKVSSFNGVFAFCDDFNQDVSSWDFSSATTVSQFMFGKSSANYDYQYYDNLLNKWASDPSEGGLDFAKLTDLTTNFGTIQYSSAGAAAHASLTAKGLIISDGGQNAF